MHRIRLATAVAPLLASGLLGGSALAQTPAAPPAPAAAAAAVPVAPPPGAPVTRPRAPVAQPVQKRPWADARFAQAEHDYVVYFLGQFPVVASYLGGDAFDPQLAGVDGRLRDYSPEGLRAEDARLAQFRARFAHLAPAGLSPRRRIDRSVALAEIAFLERQHTVRRHQQKSLDSYVDEPVRGVDWQMQGMTAGSGAAYGTEAQWQAVIARVRAVPGYLATAERQLAAGVAAHNTPDGRVLIDFGVNGAAADADYFESTLPQLASGAIAPAQRVALLDDLADAGAAAAAAYRHLAAMIAAVFFEAPDGGEHALKAEFRADRFALGEAEYDWALHNNLRLSSTAGELFAQSWPAMEATRAEMIALARAIAASHAWPTAGGGAAIVRAVFGELSRNAPQSDAEMLEGYRRAGARLIDYARATGLFDVPTDYRLDVLATPPPLRTSVPEGGLLSRAPVQEQRRWPFLRDPHGRQRRGTARSARLRLDARHRSARGLPRSRLAFQGDDAVPRADLAGALVVTRRGGGFRVDVAGLDGHRGLGAVCRGAAGGTRTRRAARLLCSRRAPLPAARQAAARAARAPRHRNPYRARALRGGGDALLRGGRFSAGPVPGRGGVQVRLEAGELQARRGRRLPATRAGRHRRSPIAPARSRSWRCGGGRSSSSERATRSSASTSSS